MILKVLIHTHYIFVILKIEINKPEYGLKTNDIEGASPHCVKFQSNRNTDPINPSYKLSSFEIRKPTPPKFIRDSISVTVV